MRRFAFKPNVALILAVSTALVITASSVVLTVFDVDRESRSFADKIEVKGLSLSTAVSDTFAGLIAGDDSQALAEVVRETRIRRDLAYLVVFSPDGDLLSGELGRKFYTSDDGFGSNAVYTETVTRRTQGALVEFASPVMLDGKAIAGVQFGFSTDALDTELRAIITHRIWQTALLVLSGVTASFLISRFITGPARGLVTAIHRVSDGGEYVPQSASVAEFDRLSSAVDGMVAQLRIRSKEALDQAMAKADSPAEQPPQTGSSGQEPAGRQVNGAPVPSVGQQLAAPPQPASKPAENDIGGANQQFIAEAQAKLEQALQQARDAQDAAQMATKSAHTINNLVTPITAYSKMARQNLPEDSPLVANMLEIEEAGNRIAQLATEIQQFVPEVPLIELTEPSADQSAVGPKAEEDVIDNNVFIDQNSTVALVVDDEPIVRRVTTSILTAEGYIVLEASNGVEAVETAKRFSNVPIRLLVTDVLMPMMGAKDLVAIMGEIHPETLVVYTSGYTAESLVSHGVMDDAAVFIPKPLSTEGLLEKIEEAVVARTQEIQDAATPAVRSD